MKPNDDNAKLPTSQRPFRVLIISGSNRRQYSCPGVDSKSRALMLKMGEMLPQDWEIDYEDLGNVHARKKFSAAMHVFQPRWLYACGHVIVMRKKAGASQTCHCIHKKAKVKN